MDQPTTHHGRTTEPASPSTEPGPAVADVPAGYWWALAGGSVVLGLVTGGS